MVHPSSPSGAREPGASQVDLGALTRDQRTVTAKIVGKFREAAVAQVLTGPRECGKTTVALAVAQSLEPDIQPVLITKSGDLPPAQKRLMQEAYGSYPYLLAAILKQLGFYVRGEEHDLVDQMVEQIRKLRREEKRILLILDDAQDFESEVWKRFQAWLDFQDGGVRMFQVLIVGLPEFKSKLTDSSLRGWRRWLQSRHELTLLSWKSIGEETRRILKQSCEAINARSKASEPVTPPSVSFFAVQRIARESGGRPGRLNELVRRTLSASIREGGCRITARFLARADALRSPAIQMYRARKAKANTAPSGRPQPSGAAGRTPTPPRHPLGWFRYALGFLLVAFVLGAGWGITAWLSIPTGDSELAVVSEEELDEGPIEEVEEEGSDVAMESSDEPLEYDLSDTLSNTETADAELEEDLAPWDDTESPWGAEEASDTQAGNGWVSVPNANVAAASDVAVPPATETAVADAEVLSVTSLAETSPLGIQMSEETAVPPAPAPDVEVPAPAPEEKPLGEIRVEEPAPRLEPVVAAPPPPPRPAPVVTAPIPAEQPPLNPARPAGSKRIANKKILEHLSRMAKVLE